MQESAKGGVILVDEASQLGTRDMLRVFDAADAVGARVILVGVAGSIVASLRLNRSSCWKRRQAEGSRSHGNPPPAGRLQEKR